MKYHLIDFKEKQKMEVINTTISIEINGGNMIFDNIFPRNKMMSMRKLNVF